MIRILVHKTKSPLKSFIISNSYMYLAFRELSNHGSFEVAHEDIQDIHDSGCDLTSFDYIVLTEYSAGSLDKYKKLREILEGSRTRLVIIYTENDQVKKPGFISIHKDLFDIGFILNKEYFTSNTKDTECLSILNKLYHPIDCTRFISKNAFDNRNGEAFVYMGRINDKKVCLGPVSDVLERSGKGLHMYTSSTSPEDILNSYKYSILCSSCDTYSLFILESMACGCIPYACGDTWFLDWVRSKSEPIHSAITKYGIFEESPDFQKEISCTMAEFVINNFSPGVICESYILPAIMENHNV